MSRGEKFCWALLLLVNLLFMAFHEYYEQEMKEYLEQKETINKNVQCGQD